MIIAGHGFVGQAHERLFKNFRREVVIHDPPKDMIADFDNTSAVVVCVPTPQADDGSCEMSAVIDVVGKCHETTPILIKSTISLQGWEELKQKYPNHRLCFSPEFLRATQWMSDIQTMKDVILSGDTDYWRDQYSYNWSEMTIKIVSPEEAIAIKYFRNAYLATKVSFFNEIHDFCSAYDLDFDQVRGGIATDERIGHSHTFVFPEQNIRGFGGMCFPKDTSALRKMAADKNISLNILDAAVKYNKEITNNT